MWRLFCRQLGVHYKENCLQKHYHFNNYCTIYIYGKKHCFLLFSLFFSPFIIWNFYFRWNRNCFYVLSQAFRLLVMLTFQKGSQIASTEIGPFISTVIVGLCRWLSNQTSYTYLVLLSFCILLTFHTIIYDKNIFWHIRIISPMITWQVPSVGGYLIVSTIFFFNSFFFFFSLSV